MLTHTKPFTVSALRRIVAATRALPGCAQVTFAGDLARAESAPFTDGNRDTATVRLTVRTGLPQYHKPYACALRDLRRLVRAPAGGRIDVRCAHMVALEPSALDAGRVVAAADVLPAAPAPYRDEWLTGRRSSTVWPDVWRVARAAAVDTVGRPSLAGVFVGSAGMVATDSYRIAALGDPAGATDWVPVAAVRALDALKVDPADVEGGRTWAGTPAACVSWTQAEPATNAKGDLVPMLARYCEEVRALPEACMVTPEGAAQLRTWAKRNSDVESVELHADGPRLVLVAFVGGRPTPDVDAGTVAEPGQRRVLCRVNPAYLADVLDFTECAPLRIGDPFRPLGAVRGDAVAVMMGLRVLTQPQRAS